MRLLRCSSCRQRSKTASTTSSMKATSSDEEGIPGRKSRFRIVLCRAIVSEEDAHGAFETASPLEKTMLDVANRKSKNSEATNGHRS